MFCFSPNSIQLDGSLTPGDASSSTIIPTSALFPTENVVSTLQEYLKECSGDVAVYNAIQAVINDVQGK